MGQAEIEGVSLEMFSERCYWEAGSYKIGCIPPKLVVTS